MKILLFCAIFCVSLRVSTLQPIEKRDINDDQSVNALYLDQSDDAKTAPVKRSPFVIYETGSYSMPSCPFGYTLHGNHCHSNNIIPANQPCTDGCDMGYLPHGTHGQMTIYRHTTGPIIYPGWMGG